MSKLRAKFHSLIDAIKDRVLSQFSSIEISDIGDIKDEVDLFRVEVHTLTKSHISSITLVVSLIIQPLPLNVPKHFDLFMEDDMTVLIVRTKKV